MASAVVTTPAPIPTPSSAPAEQSSEPAASSTTAAAAATTPAAGGEEDMSQHTCATAGCGKPAALQCPTCLKLRLPATYFCSQDCFSNNWKTHKTAHAAGRATKWIDRSVLYRNFQFTGPLRPGLLSPLRTVPAHIARPDYAESGQSLAEWRARNDRAIPMLTADKLRNMREACRLGREVLDIAKAATRVGVTTDEIDRLVHEATLARNAYPSPLNYYSFPKSCCTSINEVICHGIPDNRELRDGDIVNLDISLYWGGVHADLNETVLVGDVDEAGRRLVRVTRECLDKAIEMVRPGALYRDIGEVISKHAHANGFSVVRSFCGHGVGEMFHCNPNVPHYARNKAVGVMRAGHVFTIEPMINEGVHTDVIWPDKWTATTTDGKRSAQFEDTLLVTETGVEILTAPAAAARLAAAASAAAPDASATGGASASTASS